jgi:energy-coupling factor transporter ATP-binding protein EcfA2
MRAPALSLRGVTFRYAGSEGAALDGVTLDARAGEVTWLYGSPGAGCTTLLRVAAGLAPRHTGGLLEGEVRLLGMDPQAPAGRTILAGRVAYVTASPALQLSGAAATVFEEVAFAPANLGWPIDRVRAAVAASLIRLGVSELSERDPTTLSGGELQRVVLAAMLVLAPEVWLLDEPAAPLDRAGRGTLIELLAAEAAGGATVIVATEDADLLAPIVTPAAVRLVLLEGGRVRADGPASALLATDAVWDGGPGSTTVAELARAARGIGPAFAEPYPLTVDDAVRRWARPA